MRPFEGMPEGIAFAFLIHDPGLLQGDEKLMTAHGAFVTWRGAIIPRLWKMSLEVDAATCLIKIKLEVAGTEPEHEAMYSEMERATRGAIEVKRLPKAPTL